MATPSASPLRPGRPAHGLTDDLITLAGTPDDSSGVPVLLRSITQFTADLVPPVAYASVTMQEKGAYATVAMSSEAALAVDEAQYADQAGPCLDTLRMSELTVVPQIDATMKWPNFRAAAQRLGLRASLSIPLFAGRGTTIAALNLYARDSAAMAPLCAAVLATFTDAAEGGAGDGDAGPVVEGLGPGPRQLVDGLLGAFRVRTRIQRALGVIMATEKTHADFAYAVLRSRAAATALSLTAAADSILVQAGHERRSS